MARERGLHFGDPTLIAGVEGLCYGLRMLRTARDMLRRFGFVSAMLLALTTVTLGTEVQACAPDRSAAVAADIATTFQADPCASRECQDCGLACAHGCCHAQHVGVVEMAAAPLAPLGFRSPAVWPDVVGAPLGASSGHERPPRV